MPIDRKNQEVLITRYFAGEASNGEIVELQAWLVASMDNLLYFSFHANNHLTKQEPVYNELFAAFGTRSALKLSDGTSVWLKHTCIR